MKKIYIKSILIATTISMFGTSSANASTGLETINTANTAKVLDMNFDNNDIKNSLNGKIYTPSSNVGLGKFVSSEKGNGYEPNGSKIRIPHSDLGITSSNNIITVSFLFKSDGENSIMPISIDGTSSYSLWLSDGFFGFNTGQSEVYGIKSRST